MYENACDKTLCGGFVPERVYECECVKKTRLKKR